VVTEPGVYVGTLRHRRFAPVPHAFTYPLFMVLVDVDRIEELMQVSAFTSANRFNWAAFHDRDHLGDPGLPLRERLRVDAARHGIELDGPIFLLTHLRYLGVCFNPVSFFYCFDRGGRLQRVLAEVHNTFGGAHNYWVSAHDTAAKALYVSPFVPPDVEYAFDFSNPGASLVAHMEARREGLAFFDATLRLDRRPWTAGAIRGVLARHPLMTAGVVAGIHWEALKLWWKGVPAYDRPTV
jgi:uncharacterized protein